TPKLLRAYFIGNSPNFKPKYVQQTANVNLPAIRLNTGEIHVAQKWLAKPEHAELIYTVWDGKRRKCTKEGTFHSPRKCYKHRVVKVDWETLRPLDLWAPAPGLAEESLT